MVRAASLVDFDGFINIYTILEERLHVQRLRGATVARLTPDQKVACSNHVGVINIFFLLLRPTGTSGNVFIYQNRAAFGQNSDKVTSRSERLFNPGLGLFTAANIILPCHRKTQALQVRNAVSTTITTVQRADCSLWDGRALKSHQVPPRFELGSQDSES